MVLVASTRGTNPNENDSQRAMEAMMEGDNNKTSPNSLPTIHYDVRFGTRFSPIQVAVHIAAVLVIYSLGT